MQGENDVRWLTCEKILDEDKDGWFTIGKAYEFKDGHVHCDDGYNEVRDNNELLLERLSQWFVFSECSIEPIRIDKERIDSSLFA